MIPLTNLQFLAAVSQWNPEDKHIRSRITAQRAQNFIRYAKLVLVEIL